MNYMLFIGKRLRLLRSAKSLTQEAFAEKLGLDYKFYQDLESGRKKYIRLDTIVRIAENCKMPVWEFLKPPTKDFVKDCFVRVAAPVGRPKKVAENEPKKSEKKRKPPAK
ncbi:MAG: helix-turn-helix transcriptional regulator [Opitutales bacterium]|nr:helix-turn-helix transcriptional regulator [Opitutales bacterium]